MALIISSTQTQRIIIAGTNIQLESVYLRLEFKARMDGVALELDGKTFLNKENFLIHNPVKVEIVSPEILVNIDPATQIQDIHSAHEIMKLHYEKNGYNVTIDMN